MIAIISIFIMNSCNNEPSPIIKDRISGLVQKGPFINGTSILINDLNRDLSQTGKVYNAEIIDNTGNFEILNVELTSSFISMIADGFYFNEIFGEQSTSQITLYALSDISNSSTVNINILSHLEKPRVEYLMSHGMFFQEAKAQAQSEILEIFNINTSLSETSEALDISQGGDENAILLAISLILQGYHTEGELTELLSNIRTDIRGDGVLNSSSVGSQLINHAVYLDTTEIRNNLENRYSDLGVNAEIPNFEKYITNFINNTSFEITESIIEYPDNGLYGYNILDFERVDYSHSSSLAAYLPKGTKLKIRITSLGPGLYAWETSSNHNWSITVSGEFQSMYFTAIDSDSNCDLNIEFECGEYLIEYFEMGATEPNMTKIIAVC